LRDSVPPDAALGLASAIADRRQAPSDAATALVSYLLSR
jgi:hypothetical protein